MKKYQFKKLEKENNIIIKRMGIKSIEKKPMEDEIVKKI
jgi:hypothetical protein